MKVNPFLELGIEPSFPPLKQNVSSVIVFYLIFVRQDSESDSGGSDSSQSESDSDDDGNEPNVAPRRPPPPLSHYHPTMQLSSPGEMHPTVNNNPTTPTQKKKFDERVCISMA